MICACFRDRPSVFPSCPVAWDATVAPDEATPPRALHAPTCELLSVGISEIDVPIRGSVRSLRIVVRTTRGAVPLLVAAAVAPACGEGENVGSTTHRPPIDAA